MKIIVTIESAEPSWTDGNGEGDFIVKTIMDHLAKYYYKDKNLDLDGSVIDIRNEVIGKWSIKMETE